MSTCRHLPVSLLMLCCLSSTSTHAADFASNWDQQHNRIWIGPQYWSNPLENWRLHDGRLECVSPQAGDNVHLLTHQLTAEPGTFEISAVVGLQEGADGVGSVGFEIGIRSELGDYRSSLLRGTGLRVVLTSEGEVQTGLGRRSPAPSSWAWRTTSSSD